MKTALRLFLCSALIGTALGSCVFTLPQQVQLPPQSPITVNADITGYGLIFLRAQVNNSGPLWFALDSGASFPLVIDDRRARDLGLKLQRNATREGGGAGPDAYRVVLTRDISINLGALKFNGQTAAVIALGSLEALAGRPLDGLVGSELFTRYVVEIDYLGNKITLSDPQAYTYSGAGESLPLTLRGNHFFVPARIEMPGRARLEGQFLVDTGGGLVTAVLTSPFAQTNQLPAPGQRTILDRSLSGLGGETRLLVSRATRFSLGNLAIREPVIYVSQDKGGALASSNFDGIIGSEILQKFKVIFDYARGRLILEPNAHYREPLEYDMSGIRLRADGDDFKTFRVYQVLADSPGAEAGLRQGDVLIAIDDLSAAKFSLDEIYQMLKRPGREYKLSFRRGGETLSVKLKLRRLI